MMPNSRRTSPSHHRANSGSRFRGFLMGRYESGRNLNVNRLTRQRTKLSKQPSGKDLLSRQRESNWVVGDSFNWDELDRSLSSVATAQLPRKLSWIGAPECTRNAPQNPSPTTVLKSVTPSLTALDSRPGAERLSRSEPLRAREGRARGAPGLAFVQVEPKEGCTPSEEPITRRALRF
jgi:hypothetical protein